MGQLLALQRNHFRRLERRGRLEVCVVVVVELDVFVVVVVVVVVSPPPPSSSPISSTSCSSSTTSPRRRHDLARRRATNRLMVETSSPASTTAVSTDFRGLKGCRRWVWAYCGKTRTREANDCEEMRTKEVEGLGCCSPGLLLLLAVEVRMGSADADEGRSGRC